MKKLFFLQKKMKKEIKQGYIALISVILISAIGLAIMLSVIAAGVDASRTDFSLQQSGGARSLASSCAEEALQSVLETSTTSSAGNLTIASGTCSYLITSTNGQSITIDSTGFLGTVTSKIKVVIASTSPSISLSSWEEVSDF
jgi:hypothetical protein